MNKGRYARHVARVVRWRLGDWCGGCVETVTREHRGAALWTGGRGGDDGESKVKVHSWQCLVIEGKKGVDKARPGWSRRGLNKSLIINQIKL